MLTNRSAMTAILLGVVLLAAAAGLAEEKKFICSRDVWVSACPTGDEGEDERDTSMGKTTQLKIKTIQEMAILDFDLSSLKGKKVSGGWLHFHIPKDAAAAEVERVKLPFERKHLLKRIGLSTVSTDWVEGASADRYKVDKVGFGASFRAASHPKRPWA